MNNQQVAHAWAHGRKGTGSHLKSDGTTLTSYNTTIAARIDDIVYISADNMSPSTSRHISYIRQAVNHEREKIFYTHAFSWSGHNPALTHEAMILPEVHYIIQELDVVLSSNRRTKTKNEAIDRYNQKKTQIIELAARVGVKLPAMPEIQVDGLEAYQEAKRIQEEKKEAARVKAVKKQQKEDKKQLEIWLTTGQGSYPHSFWTRGADQITIKGDYVTYRNQKEYPDKSINQPVLKVITSQGAECPLDHAVKALRFWKSLKPGEGFQTNGRVIHLGMFKLDSIDEAGTVRAGCHTFTRATIEKFINQWADVLSL